LRAFDLKSIFSSLLCHKDRCTLYRAKAQEEVGMQKYTQYGERKIWRSAVGHLCKRTSLSTLSVCQGLSRFPATPAVLLACVWVWAFQPSADVQTQTTPVSNQHGALVTLDLPLPDLVSKTHMQQAGDFAEKLVIGFGLRPEVALEFSDWILEASARQELRPELIASLVFAESSFRKTVQSHVGAIGPTQIRPHYWVEFCGQNDLHDPEQNVYCGTQILGFLLEHCEGDQACALSAYNIGMNSNRRAAGLRYVAKIDRHLEQLNISAF
jgi:hypothetical protein